MAALGWTVRSANEVQSTFQGQSGLVRVAWLYGPREQRRRDLPVVPPVRSWAEQMEHERQRRHDAYLRRKAGRPRKVGRPKTYHTDAQRKAAVRASKRERRQAWVAAGLCAYCGKLPEDPTLTGCLRCRTMRAKHQQTYKQRRKAA